MYTQAKVDASKISFGGMKTHACHTCSFSALDVLPLPPPPGQLEDHAAFKQRFHLF